MTLLSLYLYSAIFICLNNIMHFILDMSMELLLQVHTMQELVLEYLKKKKKTTFFQEVSMDDPLRF